MPFSTLLISLRFRSIFLSYFGNFTIWGFSIPRDFFGVWVMVVVVEKWGHRGWVVMKNPGRCG